MVQYYWNPAYQQQQMTPPPVTIPSTRPPAQQEESYIENILRLNRGKPGYFYFSFDNAIEGKKTVTVHGRVEAAGRDHVILSEVGSQRRYLFPMIYFDYARFDEELDYFQQSPYA